MLYKRKQASIDAISTSNLGSPKSTKTATRANPKGSTLPELKSPNIKTGVIRAQPIRGRPATPTLPPPWTYYPPQPWSTGTDPPIPELVQFSFGY
ncbi:hypothetical protein BU26DRAFT_517755 [Trematosphaeria pertusa]|uniref:Uncharacterized protein n=1 Tax=Trematosphaeria pertusa TaxID=390896 RepID=A0A6A6IKU5_9PLEO|nr:uncharacterized protein BU26DRAFT_517755 [Trematosphaeria pertusa]KAF2251006.1 hypothetical protein BU26DRAFT_517755 [Trematosphaeria pertusa]